MLRHSFIATAAAVVFAIIVTSPAFAADAPDAGIRIRYTLPAAGKVSVAVYDKPSGRMLRTLLSTAPQEAGEHEVQWDGLDMFGNAAQPGEHEWKLLVTPGLKSEYLLTLGTSPTNAPWASWPGNHGGTTSIAVSGAAIYLSSSCSEVPPGIIKQSIDGKNRFWEHGNYEAWQGGVSMAICGDKLLQLQGNGKIQVIDPQNASLKATWDHTWKEEKPDEKDAKGQPVVVVHKPIDLSANADLAVICFKDEGLIRWLNPADGSTAGEVKLDEPAGVAAGFTDVPGDPARAVPTAFVATKDRIVAIRTDTKTPADFAAGLTEPYRLDAARTAIFSLRSAAAATR
ncbi:MAG TPA: FlgD immunoglobulin-like domain containing protein [Planctomycetota bacterium]|nr:FlgD immunoglobulin-like domain containing protein [Planctomycetota bacterium]